MEKTVKILHMYPDLLNLYGDKGNIAALTHRLSWRGIKSEVIAYCGGELDLSDIDIVFLGGGSDRDEKIVYELIPEILEEFECGLGYGDPVFPKFKSDDMIITDLEYTHNESDDTYKMFYVDGIVTITTLFGTQLEFDYQMRVGLDEEFETTGKWYAEIIDGDIFEQ